MDFRRCGNFEFKNEIFTKSKTDRYLINSNYDYAKINTLFNNADTVSFIDLTFNKNEMLEIGYSESFLKEKPAFHVIYTIFPIFNDSFGNCASNGLIEKI